MNDITDSEVLLAKLGHIKDNLLNKKIKYANEMPIVIALILQSHDLWGSFVSSYSEHDEGDAVAEEILKLVKYSLVQFNTYNLWPRINPNHDGPFWKAPMIDVSHLPIEGQSLYKNKYELDDRFYSKLNEFIDIRIKDKPEVDYTENPNLSILQILKSF